MATTLFTIGYEGLSLPRFMHLLIAYGIEVLVDVRDYPLSRKKGFSKKPLQVAMTSADKEYVHAKGLGCPPYIRHDYRDDGNWTRYTQRYMAFLKNQVLALDELNSLSMEKRCALLCFEADAQRCHRSLVACELKQQWNSSLSIIHISNCNIARSSQTRRTGEGAPVQL
jgi:uncharacterized protein (DUF488 family)